MGKLKITQLLLSTYSVLKSTLESELLALCTDIMIKDIFQSILIYDKSLKLFSVFSMNDIYAFTRSFAIQKKFCQKSLPIGPNYVYTNENSKLQPYS